MAGEVRKQQYFIQTQDDSHEIYQVLRGDFSDGEIIKTSTSRLFDEMYNDSGKKMTTVNSTISFGGKDESVRNGSLYKTFTFYAWRDDDEVFNYEEHEQLKGNK